MRLKMKISAKNCHILPEIPAGFNEFRGLSLVFSEDNGAVAAEGFGTV